MKRNRSTVELDPRIERSRRVVRGAALDELASAGYGGFSIESVGRRSGVAKSTIYRLWGNRLALIADALETLNEQPATDRAADDLPARDRVKAIVRHLAEVLTDSPFAACIPALIEAAEHDPAVREFFHTYATNRRGNLTDAIAAGVAGGDFAADTDPEHASLALAGALFYRRLLTDTPYPPEQTDALVHAVLPMPQ